MRNQWLVWLITLMSLAGCKTKQLSTERVVYKNTLTHDTILRIDTLLQKDSVIVVKDGATSYVDRWHTIYKTRNVDKIRNDTILRIDSIPVFVEIDKSKEHQASSFTAFILGILSTIVMAILIRRKK